VFLLIRHNDLPTATELQIALAGLLVAVAASLPALLRWRHTALVLTDRRLLVSAGGLRRSEKVIPLGPALLQHDAGLAGRRVAHGTALWEGRGGGLGGLRPWAQARAPGDQARKQAAPAPRGAAAPG